MLTKPGHLGPEYAGQFKDESVIRAYRYRPTYPQETFEILCDLLGDRPPVVLDAGCGTGAIARNLAPRVQRVDALDFSRGMISEGKKLPGGDRPNIRWIHAPIEEASLRPPYGMVTAGASLHWMDWRVVLPRFAQALAPGGCLAIVTDWAHTTPWEAGLKRAIQEHSTNREYRAYDLVEELQARGLYKKLGERHTSPVPFVQRIEDYVESFHARNGFSRERMSKEAAARFDTEVQTLVSPFCEDGNVRLEVAATVVWGIPQKA